MKPLIEMAREAGGYDSPQYPDNLVMDFHDLKRFAELVRADEREECAKVIDGLHPGLSTKRIAEIIRANNNT